MITEIVYTDGACSGNNDKQIKRRAGIGVFFKDNDPRNISENFNIPPITNNRAELYACIRALQILHNSSKVKILTDSLLIVNIMNGTFKAKKNLDLINQLRSLCKGKEVEFVHVRGHSGIYGNEMADKLAVSGCFAI